MKIITVLLLLISTICTAQQVTPTDRHKVVEDSLLIQLNLQKQELEVKRQELERAQKSALCNCVYNEKKKTYKYFIAFRYKRNTEQGVETGDSRMYIALNNKINGATSLSNVECCVAYGNNYLGIAITNYFEVK